jgi:DNA invertase Pin-like site-specific DNA recombinase
MKQRKHATVKNLGESALVFSYCRVSSKRQEEEGYSLDTQEETIAKYAKDKGFVIEERFRESYSARSSGRRGFDGMVQTFKKSRAERKIVLVGKVDRFTRNQEDALAVEKLGLEVHFVYEGMVISCLSSPGELLLYDIQTAIATYQSRVTGADTKRNMRRKAEQGLWPSRAPFGYKNVTRNKVKLIVPDEKSALLFKRLHQEARDGDHTLSSLTREAIKLGMQFSTGSRITASWVRKLLENPIYSGDFVWDGEWYSGRHQTLITREDYQCVVNKLGLRTQTAVNTRQADKFLYWGMLYCPKCQHSVCGETKKGLYTYYRCGAKPSSCKCQHRYAQEAHVDSAFMRALQQLALPAAGTEWLSAIHREQSSFLESEAQREHASRRDQIRRLRLQQTKLLNSHLEGHVEDQMFVAKNTELIKAIESLEFEERDAGAIVMTPEAASRAIRTLPRLFTEASNDQKRRLLELLFERSPFVDGGVFPRFRPAFKPFDTRPQDPYL